MNCCRQNCRGRGFLWRDFALNSTIGIAGLFDVASENEIAHYTEGFSETMAVWGIPGGSYVVLPFFGPSTARDAVGRLVDTVTNPLNLIRDETELRLALWATDLINNRYRLLPVETALEDSLDSYTFLREVYLQKMTYEIWDGDPPLTDFEGEEDWGDEDDWEGAPSSD